MALNSSIVLSSPQTFTMLKFTICLFFFFGPREQLLRHTIEVKEQLSTHTHQRSELAGNEQERQC